MLKSTFIHSGDPYWFSPCSIPKFVFFLATRKKTTFIKVIEIINCQENWTFTTGVKFFFFIFIHLTFDLMYERDRYTCVCVYDVCLSEWVIVGFHLFISMEKKVQFFLFYFCQIKSWYNNIKKNKKSFSRKTFRKKNIHVNPMFFFTGWLSLFLWWLFLFVIFYFGETNTITTTTTKFFFSVQFIDIFFYYYYYSMIDSSNIYIKIYRAKAKQNKTNQIKSIIINIRCDYHHHYHFLDAHINIDVVNIIIIVWQKQQQQRQQ